MGEADELKKSVLAQASGQAMVANVQAAFPLVKATAERLSKPARWRALFDYLCQRIVGQINRPRPPPTLPALG